MNLKRVGIIAAVFSFLLFIYVFARTENVEIEILEVGTVEPYQPAQPKEINVAIVENKKNKISQEEYDLLLRVCMSECGGEYGEPLEGKIAVVETVLNRCEIYGKSIKEVVTEPHQYSMNDNGNPDYTVMRAVNIAINEKTYPNDMIYFRTEHYHDFGEPYMQIGNHYFSLKEE